MEAGGEGGAVRDDGFVRRGVVVFGEVGVEAVEAVRRGWGGHGGWGAACG